MKKIFSLFLTILSVIFLTISCENGSDKSSNANDSTSNEQIVWSSERANDWYAAQPWLVGANFIPSTAINQLEMWQAETFDTATISKELG